MSYVLHNMTDLCRSTVLQILHVSNDMHVTHYYCIFVPFRWQADSLHLLSSNLADECTLSVPGLAPTQFHTEECVIQPQSHKVRLCSGTPCTLALNLQWVNSRGNEVLVKGAMHTFPSHHELSHSHLVGKCDNAWTPLAVCCEHVDH